MKNMKKALIMAIGGAALMGAASAQAAVNGYQGGVVVSSASATFAGTTVLTRTGLPSLTCTLSLDGTITRTATGADIEVTGGDVTGSFLCGTVALQNFPWTASVPESAAPTAAASNVPVPVTFNGVSVNLCGGPFSVDTTFTNGPTAGAVPNVEPSSFTFAGAALGSNCSVSGTLSVTNMVDDIDVYDDGL
ncbi:hypothetical protein Q668_18325 [Alcanivorax sp. PN-3]|nr:hypothetical protein Q668_18325 [Alcanivorax sp. PN-3]